MVLEEFGKYKFLQIGTEEETFSFPLSVLEDLGNKNIDIIIVRNNEFMRMTVLDYLLFRESDDIDDSFYIKCEFKFKPDKENLLTDYQRAICTKFHYTYLNDNKVWQYINSKEFVDILKQLSELRKVSVITPIQQDVFKVFLNPKGYKLPEILCYNNNHPMYIFDKLLQLCS